MTTMMTVTENTDTAGFEKIPEPELDQLQEFVPEVAGHSEVAEAGLSERPESAESVFVVFLSGSGGNSESAEKLEMSAAVESVSASGCQKLAVGRCLPEHQLLENQDYGLSDRDGTLKLQCLAPTALLHLQLHEEYSVFLVVRN